MLVTRKSIITGATNTIEIPGLTNDMVESWENGMMIQDAMPNITPEMREFVMTGITPEEWSRHLPEDDEDDDQDDYDQRWCDGESDVQCEEYYNEDYGYIPGDEEYQDDEGSVDDLVGLPYINEG